MWSKRQGFTLLELLITLVIVVVLVAMGAPAMTGLLDRMRVEDAVSRWQADLTYARQAAATYNTIVTVCPVGADSADGAAVLVVLKRAAQMTGPGATPFLWMATVTAR